jgi:hypothetical protein
MVNINSYETTSDVSGLTVKLKSSQYQFIPQIGKLVFTPTSVAMSIIND